MGVGVTHRRLVILAPFPGLRFTSQKLVLVFCSSLVFQFAAWLLACLTCFLSLCFYSY